MSRHIIVGHFAGNDKAVVPKAKDEIVTRLNFVSGETWLDHGIGYALDQAKELGIVPSEIGLDLLFLAAQVYAADTRISRATESQDAWTREIRLVVPVSCPQTWASTAAILKRILDFLTGDRWTIGFCARPTKFMKIVPAQPTPLIDPPFDDVNLFSGGLDSLIGAIDSLEGGRIPLLISHAGDAATSDAQNVVFQALKSKYRDKVVERLRTWMTFEQDLVKNVGGEVTTRGRSFLFFALGVFAGTGLNRSLTVNAPENGLIALNVPLDPLRIGALSTRTTHQFCIARWNELLNTLGIPGRIENPYWNKTKGEMVSKCANPSLLRKLVPMSLSCSSPAKARWSGRGSEHCGFCTPCLIRRAALNAGLGSHKDLTPYTLQDLYAHSLDTKKAEGQQIRSFQFAIQRLRSRPGIEKVLIHKPGPLYDELGRIDELAAVYRRGLDEVRGLLSRVHSRPV